MATPPPFCGLLLSVHMVRTTRFIQGRVIGPALGTLSAVTLTWIAWAVATPGDYFANGSALLFPSLGVAAVGGALGGRALARRHPTLLLVAAMLSIGYWAIAPSDWWSRPPPGALRAMP